MDGPELKPIYAKAIRLFMAGGKNKLKELRQFHNEHAAEHEVGESELKVYEEVVGKTKAEPMEVVTENSVIKDMQDSMMTIDTEDIEQGVKTPEEMLSDSIGLDLAELSCVACGNMRVSQGNQLVECQQCHSLYHQECHKPPVPESEFRDPRFAWTCFKCAKTLRKAAQETTASSHNTKFESNKTTTAEKPKPSSASTAGSFLFEDPIRIVGNKDANIGRGKLNFSNKNPVNGGKMGKTIGLQKDAAFGSSLSNDNKSKGAMGKGISRVKVTDAKPANVPKSSSGPERRLDGVKKRTAAHSAAWRK